MRLDNKLKNQFTLDNFKTIFNNLVKSKTDVYSNKVLIPIGVDGIEYENIRNNLNHHGKALCKKALSGKYLFSPFREKEIPKAPFAKHEIVEARAAKKTRTLSICTIRDTIFQTMIYNSIYGYTDKKIQKFDEAIYGYRKNKSVVLAIDKIQEYIHQGYMYGIDGDIEKFFDKINHKKMLNKINRFFKNDLLVVKYLTRFLKVKRVPYENTLTRKEYKYKKAVAIPRTLGIPQGGVLSGILANIYLYNFDRYISFTLSKNYDIKYIRYADDFLILCKNANDVKPLYDKLFNYLKRESLTLHPIDMSAINNSIPDKDKKTKAINFYNKIYIDFLGFRISPNHTGIKYDNIIKFKNSIKFIIKECKKEHKDFYTTLHKINGRILGNAIYANDLFVKCKFCDNPQKPQSWIGFFNCITDLRQVKSLDVWIRRQLFNYYFEITNTRLPKNYFKVKHYCEPKYWYFNNLESLFSIYKQIKEFKKLHPNIEFCKCEKYEPLEDFTLS